MQINRSIYRSNLFRLSEGESQGRYYASKVRPDRRNDCYKAKLTISEVLPSDSRTYRLVARNDRGAMNFAIKVEVLDPIAMTTVVGVSAALLLLLVILVFALGYAYKGRKGCFKKKVRKQDFICTYDHQGLRSTFCKKAFQISF